MISNNNSNLELFLNEIRNKNEKIDLDLSILLEGFRLNSYYRYNDKITTNECNRNIKWNILNSLFGISILQVQ